MTRWGYARVSTDDQSLDLQLDALAAAGVEPDAIISDMMSGARSSRPGLDALLARIEPGDTLVIWRLDRLGRSMLHLADLLDQFRSREIKLKSLTEGLDTDTPSGRMIFGVLSSLAEYERESIVERVRAGLAATVRRGTKLGRPRGLTAGQRQHAEQLRAEGKSFSEIAAIFGVSPSTVFRNVAAASS